MGKGAGIVAGLSQDATLAEQFEHAEEVGEARPEDAVLVYKNILAAVVEHGAADDEEVRRCVLPVRLVLPGLPALLVLAAAPVLPVPLLLAVLAAAAWATVPSRSLYYKCSC